MRLRTVWAIVVGLLLGAAASARGQTFDDIWAPIWEVETMTSRVRLQTASLGAAPLEEIVAVYSSIDDPQFPDPFLNASIVDSGTFVQPSGATNAGSWDVRQQTSLSSFGISTNLSQSVMTSTDFGSPGAIARSEFDVTFRVHTPTTITLDGSVVGNGSPGADDFGRVLLKEGNVNRFNSNDVSFPFDFVLQPGRTYSLEAHVSGRANINESNSSSIDLGVSLAPTPSIKHFSFGYLDFDRVIYCSYVDADGPGMSIIRPGELLSTYALDPQDHLVSSKVDLGSPEQVYVSGLATGRRTYEPIVFMHDFLTVDKTIFVQGPELTPDDSGEAIRPSASTTIVLPETAKTLDIDALISPRDPASGLPTGKTFGAVLFEDEGQVAIADWQWGPAGSQTTIDQPRVTVLGPPESPMAVAFLNTLPLDGHVGFTVAAAARNSVTLYDVGDLNLPGPLNPVALGTIDAGGTPFDPDMLRASSNAAGQPVFSIQQGNSIRLYEYDGVALQMTAEQLIPAGARGYVFQNNQTDLAFLRYLFEKDGQLHVGRLGEAPSRVIGFDDFDVNLNASTPAGTPTSYASLKGNAVLTIDASFVAPPGTDGIDLTAAKDAVLRLNGDMPSENTYTTAGQRAAVVANGTLGGNVNSVGAELARTFVMSNPPAGDVFDDAFADAAIAAVNPAALARLRRAHGLGETESVAGSIGAIAMSNVSGGVGSAALSMFRDDDVTRRAEPARIEVLEYQEGGENSKSSLRATLSGAAGGEPTSIAAVLPNSYLHASNDRNAPAVQGILGMGLGGQIATHWQVSLNADAGTPVVRAEVITRLDESAFPFDLAAFAWDDEVTGSDQGTMLVEVGFFNSPGYEIYQGFLGTPAEVAAQLASSLLAIDHFQHGEDLSSVRFTLTAAPGESASFANTSALISFACDPNFDGTIDRSDAAILAANFGMMTGATLAQGDCTGDGAVGVADLARLQRRLGDSGPASSASPASPVPEPSGMALAALALATCAAGARRAKQRRVAA